MKKFLKVSTASNGTRIIPAQNIVFVGTTGTTVTTLYLANTEAAFDEIAITHASDAASSGNDMINYIQSQLVKVAGGKWSESILDITDGSPKLISNVTTS